MAVIHQGMLGELADQHVSELRKLAVARQRPGHAWTVDCGTRAPGESLRVRTGWTLVGLGLRLAVGPGPGLTRTPRPTGT